MSYKEVYSPKFSLKNVTRKKAHILIESQITKAEQNNSLRQAYLWVVSDPIYYVVCCMIYSVTKSYMNMGHMIRKYYLNVLLNENHWICKNTFFNAYFSEKQLIYYGIN